MKFSFCCCIVGEYAGSDTLIHYCENGQRIVDGWSCSRRAKTLGNLNGWGEDHPYVQALYRCCRAASQFENPPPTVDFSDVQIRSEFLDSWLFKENLINLGYVTDFC